jgi:tetratricopeptide (TPR) repeat protein
MPVMDTPGNAIQRPLRPWVVFVVVGAAIVVFVGVWLVVANRRLDREFSGSRKGEHRRSKEWVKTNSMCRRLNMAGNDYSQRGMYDSALSCYREVLRVAQEEGLGDRMAAAYYNISCVFDCREMPESARFYMSAATALSKLNHKESRVLNTWYEQGTYQFSVLGDCDSGRVLLEQALAQSRVRGDHHTEAMSLNNLGLIQATLEHYDSARVLMESCAAVSHAHRDAELEAGALHGLARLQLRRDKLEPARKFLLRAAEVAHVGGLVGAEADILFDLALVRADQDQYELAQVNAEQARKLYEQAGDQSGTARSRYLIGELIDAQRWKRRSKQLDSLFEKQKEKPTSDPGM